MSAYLSLSTDPAVGSGRCVGPRPKDTAMSCNAHQTQKPGSSRLLRCADCPQSTPSVPMLDLVSWVQQAHEHSVGRIKRNKGCKAHYLQQKWEKTSHYCRARETVEPSGPDLEPGACGLKPLPRQTEVSGLASGSPLSHGRISPGSHGYCDGGAREGHARAVPEAEFPKSRSGTWTGPPPWSRGPR